MRLAPRTRLPAGAVASCCDDTPCVPPIAEEFAEADFGDRRLQDRVVRIAEALARQPGGSVRAALPLRRDADAGYRFLTNSKVTMWRILQPHITQTVKRAIASAEVIVVHDTSEFAFRGAQLRHGLGPLRGTNDQGFLAHFSLAIGGDCRPLGLLGLHVWTRLKLGVRRSRGQKLSGAEYAKATDKESQRWAQQVTAVNSVLGDAVACCHVMDREADIFPLLAQMVEENTLFVVRLARDRVARSELGDAEERIRGLVARAENVAEVEAPLSRRPVKATPASNRTFAPREARVARLGFAATTVQLRRPAYVRTGPAWLTVNVVRVHELQPPAGVEPIEWILLTNTPVETRDEVEAVVHKYRVRWIIEEYFKALKTGCGAERLELESLETLTNALAMYAPIAWQMLLLRNLSQSQPNESALLALSPTQIDVLRACGYVPLPPAPNIRQAMQAVAALGGHKWTKRELDGNADPNSKKHPAGWRVLARGMERLLAFEHGWLARAGLTADEPVEK
jgi:hypothetical protein